MTMRLLALVTTLLAGAVSAQTGAPAHTKVELIALQSAAVPGQPARSLTTRATLPTRATLTTRAAGTALTAEQSAPAALTTLTALTAHCRLPVVRRRRTRRCRSARGRR